MSSYVLQEIGVDQQDYGMSAADALKAPRLHNQILPNFSDLEETNVAGETTIEGYPKEIAAGLEQKGHKIKWIPRASINSQSCPHPQRVGVHLARCGFCPKADGSRAVILEKSTRGDQCSQHDVCKAAMLCMVRGVDACRICHMEGAPRQNVPTKQLSFNFHLPTHGMLIASLLAIAIAACRPVVAFADDAVLAAALMTNVSRQSTPKRTLISRDPSSGTPTDRNCTMGSVLEPHTLS